MRTEEIMRELWNEKRGREPIDFIPPLGVSISLPHPRVSGPQIIYGLLSLLRSNPPKAYEWSSTWGRTVVSVHPEKGFDFRFSILKSTDEKTSSFVQTSGLINPQNLFDEASNRGKWLLVLNHSLLSLEGAIIQIERMVDELVWCLHRQYEEAEPVQAYEKALNEVWAGGIRVEYAAEQDVLKLRAEDPNIPVRIYGDVLKTGKVPSIVGALPDCSRNKTPNQVETVRNAALEGIERDREPVYTFIREEQTSEKCFAVATAIAGGKLLHAGHLLTLALAQIVARQTQSKVVLEVSDTGDRTFKLVAKVAASKQISVAEALRLLASEKISAEELDEYYRSRNNVDPKILLESKKLLLRNRVSLFGRTQNGFKAFFERVGFAQTEIIPDSSCQEHYDLISSLDEKWFGSGFGVVKYQGKKNPEMTVLQKNGEPTAAAMRAAFILKAHNGAEASAKMVFVDAGESVRKGAELAKLVSGLEARQVEGAGIGFGLEIGSSTKGDLPHAEEVYERVVSGHPETKHPNLFAAAAAVFMFTRCATAEAHKDTLVSKGHRLAESFFDYKDRESFLQDIVSCGGEALVLSKELDDLMDGGEFHQELFYQARRINAASAWEDLLPRCIVVSENKDFQLFRTWLLQKAYPDKRPLVDESLLEILGEQPNPTFGDLSDELRKRRILSCKYSRNRETRSKSIFFSDLERRGYSQTEAAEKCRLYFNGNFCLVRKIYPPFEFLRRVATTGISMEFPIEERTEILKAVKRSRNITGL